MCLRNGTIGGSVLWLLLLFVMSCSLSGCLPLVTGLKEYRESADGSKVYSFITGVDFGMSANGVDRVENTRGIKPKE